jgi:GTP diphosphokinase / guanosine-3',5'-bis(diphosphate) 3'-diphosphatase
MPIKILNAARVASQWHAQHRRKGAASEPYVNHLIEVADLVAVAGGHEDAICAALLHDAIEDQNITAATITDLFGVDVAAMVCEVTDDKNLPKAERKALQVAHAPTLSPGAKLIKLADKISNVRSVASSPPIDWPQQRRDEYVDWCCRVVAGLRGANARLEDLFDDAVRSARAAGRREVETGSAAAS